MSKDIMSLLGRNSRTAGKIAKPSSSRPFSVSSTTSSLLDKSTNVMNPIRKRSSSQKDFSSRWKIVGNHLICNLPENTEFLRNYHSVSNSKSIKVAAFDLDGTLIDTKSGQRFARTADDWRFWSPDSKTESKVLEKLADLIKEKYLIVVFTNQGGVIANIANKSYNNFVQRVNSVAAKLSDFINGNETELLVFASPKKPGGKAVLVSTDEQFKSMRKPESGMWTELTQFLQKSSGLDVDIHNSIYVGDAAGRVKDFSDSDAMFAKNINCTFKTPEEFFG
ncbi:hypothetical protein G9P44_003732 [Scheffersomyces stipitis]|nr:hypothetical protein G9P44_003732 [Scheffersomyces stipitis]